MPISRSFGVIDSMSIKARVNFRTFMDARSGLVTTQHVQESITAVQRNHNPLLEWYYRLREPRQQLLALAICFFDGLYEQEQFFAAVDCLIDQAWRQRDTLSAPMGSDDLAPLNIL